MSDAKQIDTNNGSNTPYYTADEMVFLYGPEDMYDGYPVPLTGEERLLLKGLVGNYQRMMLLDLRKGALTETGIRNYRADLARAGELMAKLGGGV